MKKKKKAKKKKKNSKQLSTIDAKLNEVTTLINVFSKSENKTRVALYPGASFTDSSRANPARPLVTGKSDIKKVKHSKISTNKTLIDL